MTLQIMVVGLMLWTLLGFAVAILICPVLKDPADRETIMSHEKALEVGGFASHFRTTGQSYLN